MDRVPVAIVSAVLIGLTTAGQLLLKAASRNRRHAVAMLGFGYGLFVLTVILSFFLMRRLDLKFFTVIMSLSYVAVMMASAAMFKEKLTSRTMAGTLLVLAGAVVFAGI